MAVDWVPLCHTMLTVLGMVVKLRHRAGALRLLSPVADMNQSWTKEEFIDRLDLGTLSNGMIA